jgi:hypothetical protein
MNFKEACAVSVCYAYFEISLTHPHFLVQSFFGGWIGAKSTITAAIYWPTAPALDDMAMIGEQFVE